MIVVFLVGVAAPLLPAAVSAGAATTFGPASTAWRNYYNDPSSATARTAFCSKGGGGSIAASAPGGVPACYSLGSESNHIDIPTVPKSSYSAKYTSVMWTPGFQCVEFAERYMLVRWGWGALQANGGAVVKTYAAAHHLTPATNDGSALPKVGAVISFADQSNFSAPDGAPGHVAVVTKVTSKSIVVVGENQNGADPYHGGEATNVINKKGKIVAFDGKKHIEWLNPPKVKTSPVTNYTDPSIHAPSDIAAGSDGALWFGNSDGSIGHITPAGSVTDSTPIGFMDITKGPDGAIWFTSWGGDSGGEIGRLPTSGDVSFYNDVNIWNPGDITAGPDGALWFTNEGTGKIGRVTTHGAISYLPTGLVACVSSSDGITSGPDDAIWFTCASTQSLERLGTDGTVTSYTDASIDQYQSARITAGPDGALWFTSLGSNSIGRITTDGIITNYTDATIDAPAGITAGPDGALWFTNSGNNSIGRITTSGAVTNYTSPTIDSPKGITAGPDGALWFTNSGNDSIGRIATP